jgi:enamine deaminase RidA (YjgF/YER057c/UK114 family)
MLVALEEAGAGIEDVISTRVLVASADQSDLVSAWDVVRAFFGDHDAPSTLLGSRSSATLTSSWRSKRSRLLLIDVTVS